MTSTRAINAAAGVIHAAMQQGKTLPQTIAYALDSAGLLNSPEIAAELEHLRKRVAELDAAAGDGGTRTADEDPIAYSVTHCLHCGEGLDDENIADFCSDTCVSSSKLQQLIARPVEDRMPEALHASSGAVIETKPAEDAERAAVRRSVDAQFPAVAELLGRAVVEDPHDSDLHHPYRLGRDLPEPEARP